MNNMPVMKNMGVRRPTGVIETQAKQYTEGAKSQPRFHFLKFRNVRKGV